jgi:hypothetical protein
MLRYTDTKKPEPGREPERPTTPVLRTDCVDGRPVTTVVSTEASSPSRNGLLRPRARYRLRLDHGRAFPHWKLVSDRNELPLTSPTLVVPSPQSITAECPSSTPGSVNVATNWTAEPSTPVTSLAVNTVGATLVTVTVIVWLAVLPAVSRTVSVTG